MQGQDYAKFIEISKRVRWNIDKDLLKGRDSDFSKKFLPDGISKVDQLDSLNDDQKRLLSQIQSETYANMGSIEKASELCINLRLVIFAEPFFNK